MSNSEFARSGSTVTTVYEVLRKCQPSSVGRLAFPGSSAGAGHGLCSRGSVHGQAAASYSSTALRAMLSVSPDMEQTAERPIDPANPVQLGWLHGLSWPKALGRRVIMPSSERCVEWNRDAGAILSHLCAL